MQSERNIKIKLNSWKEEQKKIEEALEYCYKHANEFKSDMYECGENGERQFDCLIEILESGTIEPKELPDYGMDYGV